MAALKYPFLDNPHDDAGKSEATDFKLLPKLIEA